MDSNYYYYSKVDTTCEPIDSFVCSSKKEALTHFANRKDIGKKTFSLLYNIKIHEKSKPK